MLIVYFNYAYYIIKPRQSWKSLEIIALCMQEIRIHPKKYLPHSWILLYFSWLDLGKLSRFLWSISTCQKDATDKDNLLDSLKRDKEDKEAMIEKLKMTIIRLENQDLYYKDNPEVKSRTLSSDYKNTDVFVFNFNFRFN